MAAPPQGWPQLRQQARALETQTETLFHTYSQYASITPIPASPTPEELQTSTSITSLFTQRETLISSLTRLLDSDPAPSALKSSHLARHRETLVRQRAEYETLKRNISTARDRQNLLSSVRKDISSYRASSNGGEAAEAEYMLDERARLDNSNNMADSVLSQAYAVNENFGMQREQLERIRRRITGVVGMVPGVNGLIQRIGTKKRRDGVILGGFIAFCLLCFLWFL